MSGVKTSHSMGGARADRAPSVLQPPIPSHKPLGSGRTLARSYLAGFFRTRAHLPTRHHHRLPQVPPCPGPNVQILPLLLPPHHLPPHRLAPHPQACWSRLPPVWARRAGLPFPVADTRRRGGTPLLGRAIHNHLIEYDLTQYTAKRTQQKPTTQSDRIRQRHTEWVPEAGSTQVRPTQNRQKSQLGSSRFYWEDGNVCVAVGRRNPPRL